MNCVICWQAVTVDRLTSIQFERGEMRLAVNNVPAQVCPNCGEAYVDEKVAVELIRIAEAMSAAGELDNVLDFNQSINLLDSQTST
jgi:YgiT-type zinc finger domain-containing protein